MRGSRSWLQHTHSPTAAPKALEAVSPPPCTESFGIHGDDVSSVRSGGTARSSQRPHLNAARPGAGAKSAPTPSAKLETNIWRPDCAAVQPSPLFHFTFYLQRCQGHTSQLFPLTRTFCSASCKDRILFTLAVIVGYKSLNPSSTVGFFPPYCEHIVNYPDTHAAVRFMDMFGWIFLCYFPPLTLCFCLFLHADWEEEQVSSPNILRLIYQGRFLHGNVTLGGEETHAVGLRRAETAVGARARAARLPFLRRRTEAAQCCGQACFDGGREGGMEGGTGERQGESVGGRTGVRATSSTAKRQKRT